MITREAAGRLAELYKFSHHGFFSADGLVLMPEVRNMCKSNLCGRYEKSWVCPPACGTLEEIEERITRYSWGIILQTTAVLEDEFDVEKMIAAEELQKESFDALCADLRSKNEDFLPMGCGSCTICAECTYPDAPCRFPDRAVISMEACGIMVMDVCKLAGVQYYYGKNTVTYSSCILFHDGR